MADNDPLYRFKNMENIQTTPEITEIESLYQLWKKNHPGMTRTHFYSWLSAPSMERNLFLQENTRPEYLSVDSVVIIQAKSI